MRRCGTSAARAFPARPDRTLLAQRLIARSLPSVLYFGNELEKCIAAVLVVVCSARGSTVKPGSDQQLELAQQLYRVVPAGLCLQMTDDAECCRVDARIISGPLIDGLMEFVARTGYLDGVH